MKPRIEAVSCFVMLTLLSASPARAECGEPEAFLAYPPGGTTLPANATIVLVVGSPKGDALLKRAMKRGVAFVDGDERIAATFGTRHGGEQGQPTVVLSARRPLTVGRSYRLRLGPGHEWTWSAGPPDRVPPRWTGAPVQHGFTHEELGCGPDTFFSVIVPVADEAQLHFDVTLESADGARQQAYWWSSRPILEVGRWMCGGPFDVRPDTAYRLTLVPVDAGGNRGPARMLELFGRVPKFVEPRDID